jgi:cytochrome c553
MACQKPKRQKLKRFEEVRVTRRLAPMIGLLAALAPAMAHAQTNIDQGKTPAQIFANDCAACHKAARGLANGKSSGALADFLHEHYTTGRDQAAALAAYVLGAGAGPKPAVERAGAAAEEPKPPNRQTRKPEESPPSAAKPQRPAVEEGKPRDDSIAVEEPGRAGRRLQDKRGHPVTATRGRRKEPETPYPSDEPATAAHEPAAVTHEPTAVEATPSVTETPSQEASPAPSASLPTDSASGDNTPVPRDNIPD